MLGIDRFEVVFDCRGEAEAAGIVEEGEGVDDVISTELDCEIYIGNGGPL